MSSGVRFEIRGVQKVSFVLKFDTKVVTLIAIIEAIQEKSWISPPTDFEIIETAIEETKKAKC